VFHNLEGWSLIDSFYFSAITLATVGYGDFTPKTTTGKLLTIAYIFMGFGLLVALLTHFGDVLVESAREGRPRPHPSRPHEGKAGSGGEPPS
jgi:voltage-gated potassium channel